MHVLTAGLPALLTVSLVMGGAFVSQGPARADGAWSSTTSYPPYAAEPGGKDHTVTVSVPDRHAALRTYTLESTAEQREGGPNVRSVTEQADGPRVRSGSALFDALFAMAVDDARLNSVSEIRDAAYDGGRPIACDCFQTGEKWTYVWTRDLAYAADLALADFDPQRVVNSLLFKTSGFREGVQPPASLPSRSRQIVQDTGSGGSWPISTDRVAWALGAEAVLANLPAASRRAFASQAYAALSGTLEADREAAFDPRDGLYGGEQSFLDWRDQTYAPWIVANLSYMAQSKALSTNVVHYRALRLAERLARDAKNPQAATTYARWADDLRRAINDRFWLEDMKLYASLTTPDFRGAPVYKFDMLGIALTVISGVADPDRAREMLARYPHAPFGVPVYYPQQPDQFVYHNRAIWPFVSAYALKAAAQAKNSAVAAHAIDSLMRASALNLSNMENLEWLTGRAHYDDGPQINSLRQLWSVGAYLGMVTETIFGYHVEAGGVRIAPFLTTNARRALGESDVATVEHLSYKGHVLNITLQLPAAVQRVGYHEVADVSLNGRRVQGLIDETQLGEKQNRIEVTFGKVSRGDVRITTIPNVPALSHTDSRVYSPRAPVVTELTLQNGRAMLSFDHDTGGTDEPVSYNIYRDGVPVQSEIAGRRWQDPHELSSHTRYCYSVEAVFGRSHHRSHHSEPACLENGAVEIVKMDDARIKSVGSVLAATAAVQQPTLREWTRVGGTLVVFPIDVSQAGDYVIQLLYENHQHDENTGVTNAVKRLRILDDTGTEAARGIVQMPHIRPVGAIHPLRESTAVHARLKAGRYRLEIGDYFNMSYLHSNQLYSYAGGTGGPVNTAGIAEIRLKQIAAAAPQARVARP